MANLTEDLMHRTDYKLNTALLQKLQDPKLPEKKNRKPFWIDEIIISFLDFDLFFWYFDFWFFFYKVIN